MTRLTPAEHQGLARVAYGASTWPPERLHAHQRAATAFADTLRQAMPDLDDTTIGRVLFHVAAFFGPMADSPVSHTMIDGLMLSALQMTALERDQPGEQQEAGRG